MFTFTLVFIISWRFSSYLSLSCDSLYIRQKKEKKNEIVYIVLYFVSVWVLFWNEMKPMYVYRQLAH